MNAAHLPISPLGVRPKVACQLVREYIYLYGAVCPKDGTCVYLIMPTSDTACFQAFLDVLSRKFARQYILLVVDGAPNHHSGGLAVPDNITLLFLPPYARELNPKENLWEELTLRRELGKWDLTAIGINQVIGSAVFVLPAQVAEQIGNWSPIAFLAVGFASLLVALCFAEVGTGIDTTPLGVDRLVPERTIWATLAPLQSFTARVPPIVA